METTSRILARLHAGESNYTTMWRRLSFQILAETYQRSLLFPPKTLEVAQGGTNAR